MVFLENKRREEEKIGLIHQQNYPQSAGIKKFNDNPFNVKTVQHTPQSALPGFGQ